MALSNATLKTKSSVSVIVLAFNEERNLPAVIQSVRKALESKFPKYEIIIVNDGSQDDTGKVTETLAKNDTSIKVVHNPHNMGCAFSFLKGVQTARYEYAWLIPGDGEIPADSIDTISGYIGMADMVIPYVLNFRLRPLSRRIISWGYTALVNMLFGKRLQYYNGPGVIRTDLVKTAPTINSRGFTFMAPILIRLIKRRYSYVEVGIMLQNRPYGRPSISSLGNIFSALGTLSWLFWDINIAERFRGKKGSLTAELT